MPLLVGSGLVLLARPDEEVQPGGADYEAPADLSLAPAGLVVSLARSGADLPVATGSSAAFIVGASATEAVVQVDLWDGDKVVASVTPPGERTELQPRLEWTPARPGPHLMTARAVDRSGRVGLSNPVWVEVTDQSPVTVLADGVPEGFTPPGSAAEPEPAVLPAPGRAVRAVRAVAPSTAGASGPPLPTLALTADECSVKVTAAPSATAPASLVLLMVPPGGSQMIPVADLGEVAPGKSASLSTTLGGGAQAMLVAQVEDGAITAWSAPAITFPGSACSPPGWGGEVTLVDGKLHAATDAGEAYLYLEPEPGTWTRVPATGAVPNIGGVFDFSPHLPALPGPFSVHAWGRGPSGVALIGTATYQPPATGPPTVDGGGLVFGGLVLPPTTLRWVRSSPKGLSSLTTAGTIDVDPDDDLIGAHKFVWKTPLVGITHALVQVELAPFPAGSGPTDYAFFTCVVPGTTGGGFTIDFDTKTCSPSLASSGGQAAVGSYGNLMPVGSPILPGQPNVGTKNPLDELNDQIYDDPESPGGGLPWVEQRVVRVLPMAGDSWSGERSNEVNLEVDRTPKVPPGEQAYDLDLKLVAAPTPPRYRYMTCWKFTGWEDPVEAANLANQEKQQLLAAHANSPIPKALFTPGYPHLFWQGVLAANGPGPICAGCLAVSWPGLGGATVGLGGADCSSDSTFWEDPVGWVASNLVGPIIKVFEALIDLAADGFAYLKSKAVEGLLAITQCTGEFCKTLAEAVVNGALLALGVPPTIPNFDQLVALGKGELVSVAVDLAKAAGVPCDAATSAATLHGDEDLTCEGAVSALLDEMVTAINQSYLDAAKSGGITFADDMRVVPWWEGQPGNVQVEVTVKPTKYTAEEKGQTCPAAVLSASSWTAPSTTITDPDLGKIAIPKQEWATWPYDVATWELPALKSDGTVEHGYVPAKKTFYLSPARSLDLVTAWSVPGAGLGVSLPYQVSPYAFLFHKDATFQIHVGGSCARAETHTYTLNGGATKLVSVVEG